MSEQKATVKQATEKQQARVRTVYDRIFKRTMSLSSKAVVNLINGLYGTHHSSESAVFYQGTEAVKRNLGDTMADLFVQIDRRVYHLEAQMAEDGDLVSRVFDYGYMYAERHKSGNNLTFPEPKIIYLYSDKEIPENLMLHLNFGTQGTFDYQVSTFNFIRTSVQELNEKKMVLLIPFLLLKLRKMIEKQRDDNTLEQLKHLLIHDILGSIEQNLKLGNIEPADAMQLKELTVRLYKHLYANYDEMERDGVNEIVDDIMELESDKWIAKYKTDMEKNTKEVTERVTKQVAKQTTLNAARNLLDVLDVQTIAEKLGLAVEEVQQLKKQ